MNTLKLANGLSSALGAVAWLILSVSTADAAALQLSDSPLFLSANVPPMNMLVVGRDHKLYYEAYNDHSDLNGDGVLDTRYKPDEIDYYGYFDSYKCYSYDASGVFLAVSENPSSGAGKTKKCSGQWSGDFLNYLTMSRIDALRKVLYGGYRSTDSNNATVLERSYIPQDAHSWGKEYSSTDGYLISDYTPLSAPAAGTHHLFANTSPLYSPNQGVPLLRVLTNRTERVWEWLSTERAVAGLCLKTGQSTGGGTGCNGSGVAVTPTDYAVRVKVCDDSSALKRESNCTAYSGGNTKPTGILQDFGGTDSMLFGLITGSYSKNTSGGVLRRAMGSIKDEINSSDGTFKTDYNGIITTLNRLRTTGFGGSYQYDCGWTSAARVINEGECQMWGNPVAEMMYEGVRYFAGKKVANPPYAVAFGAGEESKLAGGGLPVATWDDPYAVTGRYKCAKPFETVVSDINPSYDTDQLPGVDANFSTGYSGDDISGLSVSSEAKTIWDNDATLGGSKQIFIGQSGAVIDNAPTAKTASNLADIRGLAPEEPTKRGGYYAASVAHYARTHVLNSASNQKMQTFAVALASPLPRIEIPINGRKITLVPFAKSVAGSGIDVNSSYQPTDQIVDFYVDTLTDTYGKFRVNYEDVEQGADHDMDAIAVYEYTVVGGKLQVTVTSEYAAGGITQHMGYIISGTTADGIYLEVLDQRDGDTPASSDPDYFLDTPSTFTGTPPAPNTASGWKDGKPLPFVATRTFDPGTTDGATFLKDPLWYAAKWGGFRAKTSADTDTIPSTTDMWDSDGDGTPDNYFLVTNALNLEKQLTSAFEEIIKRSGSGSSAAVNSGSINNESMLYQAKFNAGSWTGQLLAYAINSDGTLQTTPNWDASAVLPAASNRKIYAVDSTGTGVPFTWAGLDTTRRAQLEPTGDDAKRLAVLQYLRGDSTSETKQGSSYHFRDRDVKLGDIINSAPNYVGRPALTYSDTLESAAYSDFRTAQAARKPVVYVGGNDGMLHGFNASRAEDDTDAGKEVMSFVPSPVFGNLKLLTNAGYSHKFYVDGSPTVSDAFVDGGWKTILVGGLNAGGQGIYALNVTDPSKFSDVTTNAQYGTSNQNGVVMWEFTDANDADLGYTYSQPIIVRTHDATTSQRWVAIFGNGYNNTANDGHVSSTGRGVLYVVDLATGALIRKIDTQKGSTGTPNGLATPTAVDTDGDGVAEYVYAGDLRGNVWKFDLKDGDPANWNSAYLDGSNRPLPLYIAKDRLGVRQPITSQIRVGRDSQLGGLIVSFGTGQLLQAGDQTSSQVQSLYGLFDADTGDAATDAIDARSDLREQKITAEYTGTTAPPASVTVEVRTVSKNTITSTDRGWYLDLATPPTGTAEGERMIANPRIRNGRILFVTVVPSSDPCVPGGKTRLMELDLFSGGQMASPGFDLNGDGLVNTDDAQIKLSNGTVIKVPPSSITLNVTYGTSPGIIAGNAAEYYYVSGTSSDKDGGTPPPSPCLAGGQDLCGIRGTPGDNAHGRQSWRQIR